MEVNSWQTKRLVLFKWCEEHEVMLRSCNRYYWHDQGNSYTESRGRQLYLGLFATYYVTKRQNIFFAEDSLQSFQIFKRCLVYLFVKWFLFSEKSYYSRTKTMLAKLYYYSLNFQNSIFPGTAVNHFMLLFQVKKEMIHAMLKNQLCSISLPTTDLDNYIG